MRCFHCDLEIEQFIYQKLNWPRSCKNGNLDYPHFISNNIGLDKGFPGGPRCQYKGSIVYFFGKF